MQEAVHDAKRKSLVLILLVLTLIITLYELVPAPSPKSFIAPNTQYYYPLLTKGILTGHLSLPVTPDVGLQNLFNPYDPVENGKYRRDMFDASLYKGKYYLYFGPLPLLYYIPYDLVTGKLPSAHACILFFLVLGFGAGFYLLIKIRRKYFPDISNAQTILAGLVLGVCNNALFLIGRPSVYEIAIGSAFCFMNLTLLFLFNMVTNNFKIKDIVLFSLCLALCVAGRPIFVLVCLLMVPVLFLVFLKLIPRNNLFKASCALIAPMLLIGGLIALYNYERFDSIFEFGLSYQIADFNRMTFPALSFDYHNWSKGLYYYFFSKFDSTDWMYISHEYLKFEKFRRAFILQPSYPMALQNYFNSYMRDHVLISWQELNYTVGYIRSIFTTAPIALFIFALPLLFLRNKDANHKPLLLFISLTTLALGVIVFYLISIGGASQRYVTDFLAYLMLVVIVVAWSLEQGFINPVAKKGIQLLMVMLELASIFLSLNV